MVNIGFPQGSVPRLSLFSVLKGVNIYPQLTKTSNSKNGAVFLDGLVYLLYLGVLCFTNLM